MHNSYFLVALALVLIAVGAFPSVWAIVASIAGVVAFVLGEHFHKHDGYPCYTVGRRHLTTDGAIVLLLIAFIAIGRVLLGAP